MRRTLAELGVQRSTFYAWRYAKESKNKHATEHFWPTEYPIVRSLEPGEDWRWCYVDEALV